MPFNLRQVSSNMLRLKSRMPLIFRALALKYAHNFIHTEVKTNCITDLRCLIHKQDPEHTLQEVPRAN